MNHEPKVFNKTSFIAALDQEELWDRNTQKMITRNRKVANIMRRIAGIAGTVSFVAVSALVFLASSHPESSMIETVRAGVLVPSFIVTLSMILGVNTLHYFTVRTSAADRQHWLNTWGVPAPPQIIRTASPESKAVLISVISDGQEQEIGYFDPDGEIFEYFTN